MIRVCDCDKCKHRTGFEKGYTHCDAFPDGVPYEHMYKDVRNMKECNNGIGFEPMKNDISQ